MDDDHSLRQHRRVLTTPGHLLRRCQQIAVALFLDECAPLNLTPLQFVVLSALADHGARDQASLGGLTATDRTTVQVVLGNLRKLGLVTLTKSRVDKRAKVVEITPAGRELMRAAIPLVERTQERIVAPLNRRERDTLTRLLGKIADKNNLESRAPLREPRAAVRTASEVTDREIQPAAFSSRKGERPALPSRKNNDEKPDDGYSAAVIDPSGLADHEARGRIGKMPGPLPDEDQPRDQKNQTDDRQQCLHVPFGRLLRIGWACHSACEGLTKKRSTPRAGRLMLRHHAHDPFSVPEVGRIEHHLAGPAIDVPQTNDLAHEPHALALFILGHEQRFFDRFDHAADVVWVNDQRLRQFPRCARKRRKQQHAPFIVTRGDKLLRNEVHPVVKTRDNTQVSRTEQFEDFVGLVMTHDQFDRLERGVAVPRVDGIDQFRSLFLQAAVGRKLVPGRCRDLKESEATFPFRPAGQELVDGSQAIEDAFGIVKPFDADAQSHVIR